MSDPFTEMLEDCIRTHSARTPPVRSVTARRKRRAPPPPEATPDRTESKLAAMRAALETTEMDALRFKHWFSRQGVGGKDLDHWRRHIDSLILKEKSNGHG
jgi:hypothetical protein